MFVFKLVHGHVPNDIFHVGLECLFKSIPDVVEELVTNYSNIFTFLHLYIHTLILR